MRTTYALSDFLIFEEKMITTDEGKTLLTINLLGGRYQLVLTWEKPMPDEVSTHHPNLSYRWFALNALKKHEDWLKDLKPSDYVVYCLEEGWTTLVTHEFTKQSEYLVELPRLKAICEQYQYDLAIQFEPKGGQFNRMVKIKKPTILHEYYFPIEEFVQVHDQLADYFESKMTTYKLGAAYIERWKKDWCEPTLFVEENTFTGRHSYEIGLYQNLIDGLPVTFSFTSHSLVVDLMDDRSPAEKARASRLKALKQQAVDKVKGLFFKRRQVK